MDAHGFGPFWIKLLTTIEARRGLSGVELARAKGVPVHHVDLTSEPPVPIWDFSQTQILLKIGYLQMKSALEADKIPSFPQPPGWLESLMNWISFGKHEI